MRDADLQELDLDLRLHAASLREGNDYAIPEDCAFCRRLKDAGALTSTLSRGRVRYRVRLDIDLDPREETTG